MELAHLLAPQHAAFHDVGLFHRAHPALALAGQLEGDAGDALDLGRRVDLGVDAAPRAVGQFLDAARVAEVDAASELAHDHDVEALDHLELEGGGLGQGVEDHRRTQVGEQVHFLAEAQEAALGLLLEGQGVPLGAADGAQQDRVRRHGVGHGRIGQGGIVGVEGGAADQVFRDLEGDGAALVHPLDNAAHLGHYLGADAVARQNEQFLVGGHGFYSLSDNLLTTEAQRHRGTEAQRHRGTEAQRHRGTEAQRHRGTEAQRHRGTEAQRHRGTEAQRHRGTEAQRHRDIETQRHTEVSEGQRKL